MNREQLEERIGRKKNELSYNKMLNYLGIHRDKYKFNGEVIGDEKKDLYVGVYPLDYPLFDHSRAIYLLSDSNKVPALELNPYNCSMKHIMDFTAKCLDNGLCFYIGGDSGYSPATMEIIIFKGNIQSGLMKKPFNYYNWLDPMIREGDNLESKKTNASK